MSIKDNFTDWEKFKKNLGLAVKVGDTVLSDNTIDELAKRAGDFLANNIDPANNEQKALKELWAVANENEKKVIAHLMVKLVTK